MQTDIKKQLDDVLSQYKGEKSELIPILQETQEKLRYLPAEAMQEISRFLRIPESAIFGVSTFYAQFKLTPLGRKIIKICRGTACHVRGGGKIMEEIEKELGIKAGETTEDLEHTLESIACFGSCALAPVMVVDKTVYGRMTPAEAKSILSGKK